ncbi:MAG: hypothetical protein LBS41_03330 [Streptococcaceae bacterium]|nr:hypothetical protein [Streptococcaceae bacterium]
MALFFAKPEQMGRVFASNTISETAILSEPLFVNNVIVKPNALLLKSTILDESEDTPSPRLLALPSIPTDRLVVTVDSWNDYKYAVTHPEVGKVILGSDLIANSTFGLSGSNHQVSEPTGNPDLQALWAGDTDAGVRNTRVSAGIVSDMIVDGGGHTITQYADASAADASNTASLNFTRLGAIASARSLYVQNLNLVNSYSGTASRTNVPLSSYFGVGNLATSGATDGANWQIYFDQVSVLNNGQSANNSSSPYGLIDLPAADVFLSGTCDFYRTMHSTQRGAATTDTFAFIRANTLTIGNDQGPTKITGTSLDGTFFYASNSTSRFISQGQETEVELTTSNAGADSTSLIVAKEANIAGKTFKATTPASFYRSMLEDASLSFAGDVSAALTIGQQLFVSAAALDTIPNGGITVNARRGSTFALTDGASLKVVNSATNNLRYPLLNVQYVRIGGKSLEVTSNRLFYGPEIAGDATHAAATDGSELTFSSGVKATFDSTGTIIRTAQTLAPTATGVPDNTYAGFKLTATGSGTEVVLNSTLSANDLTPEYNGGESSLIQINLKRGQNGNSYQGSLDINDQARFQINSQGASDGKAANSYMAHANYYYATVDNAAFEINQNGDSHNGHSNIFRYYYSGNSGFNVKNNGVVRFIKTADAAPGSSGIRFTGNGNQINITDGSSFYLENDYAKTTGKDAGQNGDTGSTDNSAAIVFPSDTDQGDPCSFNVTGKDSVIKLLVSGPIIDAARSVDFNIGPKATIEAIGKTAGGPLISSYSGRVRLMIDSPLYYNLQNNATPQNTLGGLNTLAARSRQMLVSTRSADNALSQGNVLSLTDATLSVWYRSVFNGMDGSATNATTTTQANNLSSSSNRLTLNKQNIQLSGTVFQTVDSASNTYFDSDPNYGVGLNKFARISGNAVPPRVSWVHQPTDADQAAYVQIEVFDGFDSYGVYSYRKALPGEVHLIAKIGDQMRGTDAAGLATENINLYGTDVEGVVKIPSASGGYLTAGDQVRVIKLWQGDATYDSDMVSVAWTDNPITDDEIEANQALGPTATTIDMTPPTTQVNSPINGISNISTSLSFTQSELQTIFLKVNHNTMWQDSWEVAVGTDQKNLSRYLTAGDQIQIYSKDYVDNTAYQTPTQGVDITGVFPGYQDDSISARGNLVAAFGSNAAYHDLPIMEAVPITVLDALPYPHADQTIVGIYRGGSPIPTQTAPQVGDVIRYEIGIENTNTNPDANWQDVIVTNLLPKLLAEPQTIKLDGTTVTAEQYMILDNTDPSTMADFPQILKVTVGDVTHQVPKTLTFEAVITEAAIGKAIENTVQLTGGTGRMQDAMTKALDPFGEEAELTAPIEATATTAGKYQVVIGALSFGSYPRVLDFGIKRGTQQTVEYRATTDRDLAILDTRESGQKTSWDLKLKMTQPFTNSSGKVLSNVLYFRDGSQDQLISAADSILHQEAESHSASKVEKNLTNIWGTSKYFVMKLFAGKIPDDGTFTAELTWTLSTVP